MKINRLFEIVTILLNNKVVTAKELAERFGVSTRTIYRDIDILSTSGVPIYTNKGSGGGISLLENYVMRNTMLNETEIENLLITLQTLRVSKHHDVDSVIEKLSSIFSDNKVIDWIEVDISDWGADDSSRVMFNTLKEAIINSKTVTFNYYNSNFENSLREVCPLKLKYKAKAWYLNAYCKHKNAIRLFKLTRIKNLTMNNDSFERDIYSSLVKESSKQTFNMQLVKLKLRFHKDALYNIYDYFNEEDLHFSKEYILVDYHVPLNEWVYNFILSFGSKVKVLEPQFIIDELNRRINKLYQNYN